MSDRDAPRDRPPPREGAATAAQGTPVPVDTSMERRERAAIAVFLAGPVIWGVHFMVVYLVTEAGCTGDGPGLRLFDPPVPTVVTLAATVVATVACLVVAWYCHRWWRTAEPAPPGDTRREPDAEGDDWDAGRMLAFGGYLLSLLSAVTVLFVGLPALALPPC